MRAGYKRLETPPIGPIPGLPTGLRVVAFLSPGAGTSLVARAPLTCYFCRDHPTLGEFFSSDDFPAFIQALIRTDIFTVSDGRTSRIVPP